MMSVDLKLAFAFYLNAVVHNEWFSQSTWQLLVSSNFKAELVSFFPLG